MNWSASLQGFLRTSKGSLESVLPQKRVNGVRGHRGHRGEVFSRCIEFFVYSCVAIQNY